MIDGKKYSYIFNNPYKPLIYYMNYNFVLNYGFQISCRYLATPFSILEPITL